MDNLDRVVFRAVSLLLWSISFIGLSGIAIWAADWRGSSADMFQTCLFIVVNLISFLAIFKMDKPSKEQNPL